MNISTILNGLLVGALVKVLVGPYRHHFWNIWSRADAGLIDYRSEERIDPNRALVDVSEA